MNAVDNIQGMGGKGELRLHNAEGHTAEGTHHPCPTAALPSSNNNMLLAIPPTPLGSNGSTDAAK